MLDLLRMATSTHQDPTARVLVVAGELARRRELREKLDTTGCTVDVCADGFAALDQLAELRPELVLADYDAPGLWGSRLLRKIKQWDPHVAVIFVAESCSWQDAVRSVKEGAFDFLRLPVDQQELVRSVANALSRRKSRFSQRESRRKFQRGEHGFAKLVGTSLPMQALYKAIQQVAPSRASVLISGESGTGKELVARAIHDHSQRKEAPFVSLNCAALAENLLESELFGHEKGAFTGAWTRREGRFRQAHEGTLFLDEVAEIPLPTQVKLLRFLQERTFQRVGGNETIKVDVRILAATNQDLPRLISSGRFREDLYYRLNVISLYVPPLRDKAEDIPLLAMHFLRKYSRENDRNIVSFTDHALSRLMSHDWPGNVRELENTIERAVVLAEGPEVRTDHLPPSWGTIDGDKPPAIPGSSLEELERYAILKTLEMTGGSTSKAAKVLGVSTRKIQYKLKEYRRKR
jgi:DNA-binding NtrC family response regulator